MYGKENNLDVSIKASDMEDILKRVPTSFEKVGIEFSEGNIRIRVKTDDSQKQVVMNKQIDDMEVRSPGYLLVEVNWFKQIMGKFGDNLRISWKDGEQILLEDEKGSANKTPLILDDINILDTKKIFPYKDSRIYYPIMNGKKVETDENGNVKFKPSDVYATIPYGDMQRAIKDAVWSKNDYVSFHLVPGESFSSSGKYDAKGTKARSNMDAEVGGSGNIDLPKSIDEFIKVIDKDGKLSLQFSEDFPAVTMIYEKEGESIFYTVIKMVQAKP